MLNQNLLLAGDDAYNLTRSLRFRSSASAYLSRTASSTVTDNKKLTASYWIKRGRLSTYSTSQIIMYSSGGDRIWFDVQTADTLSYYTPASYANVTGLFRDPSAWYHIVMAIDTTQATAANRVRVYVNGVERSVTGAYPSLNQAIPLNTASQSLYIGSDGSGSYFDGYLAEVNFIDGQALTPSSFGETSTTTGVWQPIKYTGTYGTNGFYLPFTDVATTSGSNAGLGKDFSGNGNYWTTNNISITSGATYDSMTDVPTLTNATTANYCVLNPLDSAGGGTVSNGNLKLVGSGSTWKIQPATLAVSNGKWYFEAGQSAVANSSFFACGVVPVPTPINSYTNLPSSVASAEGWSFQLDNTSTLYFWYGYSGSPQYVTISTSFGTSDVAQIAVDIDSGKIWVGKNNTWYDSSGGTTGNPATGANPTASNISGTIVPFLGSYGTTAAGFANFGQRPFAYTPPTGFVALNTFNLPTPTIGATASSQAGKYFNPVLYTGNSSGASVTGVGFAPEFIWTKSRSNTTNHELNDIVRGGSSTLFSNVTNAEATQLRISTFGSDGWTYTTDSNSANTGYTYVGWCWKANGSGSTNTAGSITSTVSANTTAGFSIVTYTGTGANATVGHGLGIAPKMVIVKRRDSSVGTYSWCVYHASLPSANYSLQLVSTAAQVNDSSIWNTAPTSTVFGIGSTAGTNASSATYVAYCFAPIAGYSAFGSYTGNGSSDGVFVYTGFRPKWLLLKNTGGAASWYCLDSSRNTYNVVDAVLCPNSSQAEVSITSVDFLSNGFKLRTTTTDINGSGTTYIYAAFAENPFKYSLAR